MSKEMDYLKWWFANDRPKDVAEEPVEQSVEEARESLRSLVRFCFEVVPPELEALVKTADAHWCHEMIVRAFNVSSVAELIPKEYPEVRVS